MPECEGKKQKIAYNFGVKSCNPFSELFGDVYFIKNEGIKLIFIEAHCT